MSWDTEAVYGELRDLLEKARDANLNYLIAIGNPNDCIIHAHGKGDCWTILTALHKHLDIYLGRRVEAITNPPQVCNLEEACGTC